MSEAAEKKLYEAISEEELLKIIEAVHGFITEAKIRDRAATGERGLTQENILWELIHDDPDNEYKDICGDDLELAFFYLQILMVRKKAKIDENFRKQLKGIFDRLHELHGD